MEEKNVIQQDWYDREFVTSVHFGMTKLVSFLNRFEAEVRFKLAMVNEQLTRLERNCDFVEAMLRYHKPDKIKPMSVDGTLFDTEWRQKEWERKMRGMERQKPILKKISVMKGIIKVGAGSSSLRFETKEDFEPTTKVNVEDKKEIEVKQATATEQKSEVIAAEDKASKVPVTQLPAAPGTSGSKPGASVKRGDGKGTEYKVPPVPGISAVLPPSPGDGPPPRPNLDSPPGGPPPGPPGVAPGPPGVPPGPPNIPPAPVVPQVPPAVPQMVPPGVPQSSSPPPVPGNLPGPPPTQILQRPPEALPKPAGPGQPPPMSFTPPGPPLKPPSQRFEGPPVFESKKDDDYDNKNSDSDDEEGSSYDDPEMKEFVPPIPADHDDIWIQRVKPGNMNKPAPASTSLLIIDYTGWLKNTGECFDQIDEYEFQMGSGENIDGLERILLKMREGENILAYIPSKQGYGEEGGGDVIPPNSDLVFDLTLRSIQ